MVSWQHHIARPCQINPAARIMDPALDSAGRRRCSGERNVVHRLLKRVAQTAALLAVTTTSGWAQSPADFYKGKTVELYIGYSVGGAYDLYARMLARYLGQHIPGNPTVVPKNMEGAGSLRLANWLYNVGPKDGTAMAIIGRGTGFDPILGNSKAQFDGPKFTWIGSANNEVSVCVAWHSSGVTKFDDLLAKELIVGGTSSSADTDQFPKVVNGVLGTKMRDHHRLSRRQRRQPRHGARRGAGPLRLVVVEREVDASEVAGREKVHRPDAVRAGEASRPAEHSADRRSRHDRRAAADPQADLRAAGDRPAVPGAAHVPTERADALRKAFMDTMKDPAFLADAEKAKMEITPVAGDQVAKLDVRTSTPRRRRPHR